MDYDAETFAYIVITFGLVIAFFAFIGIILADKPDDNLKSNDEYDKKILKARRRCKNKQL